MTSEAIKPAPICAACQTPLHGRYCHACGQDTRARPGPLREMIMEVATSYSPIDGKLARTLSVLATRPGHLLETYRAGAGSLYVTPLKLFVAATALFLALLNFSSTTLYQSVWKVNDASRPVVALYDAGADEVKLENATYQERWLQKRVDPAVDAPIVQALESLAATEPSAIGKASVQLELADIGQEVRIGQRLSEWLPNILWLLMPIYAFGLIPLFGRRRLFLEHVIFAMWAHAIGFVMMMGLAAINSRGANLQPFILIAPYMGYFTVAASRYYAMPLWQVFWRGLAHLAGYIFLVLFPVSLVVYATVIDWSAVGAWLSA